MSREASNPLTLGPDSSHTDGPFVGLVQGLIDDAAIFPPGNAPLELALRAHGGYTNTRYESAVGPLLLRASMIEELRALADPGTFVRVGLVADNGLPGAVTARDKIQDDAWLELVQVEIALTADNGLAQTTERLIAELPFTVPTYIEVPQHLDPEPVVASIAADGAERAKFRCGPVAVPTSEELARFLICCARYRVGFKLTAGLHHALPFTDADSGVRQHGFLNALAATWLAMEQSTDADVTAALNSTQLDTVVSILMDANVARLRSIFHSFGSCSISEPIDELHELGLLEEAR